jgi:hypothetical protein
MERYEIFYKQSFVPGPEWATGLHWDLFVSAYNASERVRTVFDQVAASRKLWIVHPEYGLAAGALPPGTKFTDDTEDEAEFILALIDAILAGGFEPLRSTLCIDITGLLRPHLLFLVKALERLGVRRFQALYSEPDYYSRKGATPFSAGSIVGTRQVRGYEGVSNPDTQDDLLIIGMGFDAQLVKEVAEEKDKAEKIQLFGLPSLRADMYQQSVLRSREVADLLGDPSFSPAHRATAPANDPFVTAAVLSEVVSAREAKRPPTNLYFCPLGTKVQALGFSLFYIAECQGRNRSILFPFSTRYSPETTQGLSRIWLYTIEFPVL